MTMAWARQDGKAGDWELRHPIAASLGHALQIGAGAERSAFAAQDGNTRIVIVLEFEKRCGKRIGCGPVHRIARLRPIYNDSGHRTVAFHTHGHVVALIVAHRPFLLGRKGESD